MKKRYTWHILHLVMTILTGALWLPIWIICGLLNSQHNKKVDDYYIRESLKCGRVMR